VCPHVSCQAPPRCAPAPEPAFIGPLSPCHPSGYAARLRRSSKRGLAEMNAVLWLILKIIDIYVWIIILQVVLSWLIAFNVVNTNNRFVYMVGDFLYRITEPAMRPIRRILPSLGGIDLSPLVLLLLLIFAERLLIEYWPA
jgi:YggT family protein